MKEIIKTENLSKRYGDTLIVKGINLSVMEGTIYGFCGPNGAGKSTTLKMLLGLVRPTEGEISLFGKKMTAKNRMEILRQSGSLIESPSYYGHLTGRENLEILQGLLKVPEENVEKVLKIVRLDGQGKKKVSAYSLGMKQRLAIAQAIMEDPDILILDEPMNGLDKSGVEEMRELFLEMKSKGKVILLASHNREDINILCDEVYEMENGSIALV